MTRRHLVLVAVLSVVPVIAAGQWRNDYVWRGSQAEPQRDIRPTHWVEGATIGAAVLGTTGGFLGYFLACEFADDHSACGPVPMLTGTALGVLTGGMVGALVGGFIPAERPRPLSGNPGKGALIGGGVGTLWGFGVLMQFCHDGCNSEEVVFGLSTTAAGALAGFLVGR